MAALLPLFLDVDGRSCLVVGGGPIAARKVTTLVESGALVRIVSPSLTSTLEELIVNGNVAAERRAFRPEDLDGCMLAIAATDDPVVNADVVTAARHRGILVGSVDQRSAGDFSFGAVVRRDELTVAISTNGQSPAFGRWLRDDVAQLLTSDYLTLLGLATAARQECKLTDGRVDAAAWRAVNRPALVELIRQGNSAEARRRLREALTHDTQR